MAYSQSLLASYYGAWSVFWFLGMPSCHALFTSTKSSLPDAIDDDVFTFTEYGRSFVDHLQPPLLPANNKPEVGHVVIVQLEFKTLIGSVQLLHRDPRRRLDDDVIDSSSEIADAARRHVTKCTREAEIRVQLKIGMLHVSVTYDKVHVACVSVGQGKHNCKVQ